MTGEVQSADRAVSAPVARPPARVTHVTARYAPFVGGLEVVVAAHATELARQGSHVEVLTTRKGASRAPSREVVDGVVVRRFRSFTVSGASFSPGLALALLRQRSDTVTHAHVPHAGTAELVRLVSRLRRLSYALHFHLDVDASSVMGRALPAYKRLLLAPTIRDAGCVFALTPELADFLHREYAVPRERLVVLPNGVDASFFDVSRAPAPRAVDRPFRLLHVGRLSVQKNLPRLLGALALVEGPVELVLVGEGECRRSLERLVREHELPVRFVGVGGHDQVREWIEWADVMVSSSDREGMPLALLESMAAGLPVLCTDVPGSRELVEGAGMVVPASEQGLARGVEALRECPDTMDEMASSGRARARQYAWPSLSRRVVQHYASRGLSR